jgi:predicted nucleic acid-binding Zn ribbon protein
MLRLRMMPPRRHIPPLGPPKRSARERVLAAWRGVNVAPIEKAQARREKSADQLVGTLFKSLRMDKRQAEAEIVQVWNNLIDPTITAHAQPTGIHKGTLFVTVDSSVWLSEIVRYRRKEILARLQSSFGKEMVAKISFRAG